MGDLADGKTFKPTMIERVPVHGEILIDHAGQEISDGFLLAAG
jgi:hypothetical protein